VAKIPWKKILLEGDAAVLTETVTPSPVDGSPAAIGTSTEAARADHRHALGPLVADMDFAEYEGDALSLETRADLPAVLTTKQGRVGFYTYDQHPYIYTLT